MITILQNKAYGLSDFDSPLNIRGNMIYTVTLNPALDYVMSIEGIKEGETNRSVYEAIRFGGKGINVSFVLKELGVSSTALGFVGGFTGNKLVSEVLKSGIKADFVSLTEGNTRINVKLKGNLITEINADGPCITESDIGMLLEKLNAVKDGDTVVLSGSVPKNTPKDIYERLLTELSGKSVKVALDTGGERLACCLRFNPWLVKPNKSELEEAVGRELRYNACIVEAARELTSMGAKNVLITLGEYGAILVSKSGDICTHKGFEITAVNTVGAGDSALAGCVVGLDRGNEYALRLACACGAATAANDGLATKEEIFKLLEQ